MTALFGPQNANAALILPSGTNSQRYGTAQTFVKDCTAPGRNDGTVLDAAFYNRIIGNLDYFASQSGITAVPGDMTAIYRAVMACITGNAPADLNTLRELADALNDDPSFATNVFQALGNRLRFDVYQGLTDSQLAIARANLGMPAFGTAAALDVGTAAGNVVQLNGSGKLPAVDGSQLTGVIATSIDTVGLIEWWPTTSLKTGRLKAYGTAVSRTTYAALFAYLVNSSAVTFTNGSANVSWPAHNREQYDTVKLFTTGSLPVNFTAGTHGLASVGTNYFVKSIVDANTVTLSLTPTGAAVVAGSAGSGTHTAVHAPCGDGDGTTTFTLPELRGEFIRGLDSGRGIDANRSAGSAQADAFQEHHHTVEGYILGIGGSDVAAGTDYNIGGTSATSEQPGVAGAPRTAPETRPRNIAMMPTIRYQ